MSEFSKLKLFAKHKTYLQPEIIGLKMFLAHLQTKMNGVQN